MTSIKDKEEIIKEIKTLLKSNEDTSDICDDYDYGFANGVYEAYSNVLDLIEGDDK